MGTLGKFFRYLSKARDYEDSAIGRPQPTAPDKLVMVLNQAKDALVDARKHKETLENALPLIYTHAKNMLATIHRLEDENIKLRDKIRELEK